MPPYRPVFGSFRLNRDCFAIVTLVRVCKIEKTTSLMMDFGTFEDCPKRLPWIIVLEIINGILFLVMLGIVISFIKNKEEILNKISIRLYVTVLIFFMISLLIVINYIPWRLRCESRQTPWTAIYIMLMGLQSLFVMCIWYYRVYKLFKDTLLALSKPNIIIFTTLISLYSSFVFFIFPPVLFFYLLNGDLLIIIIGAIVVGISATILVITVVGFCAMLFYKLIATYKYIDPEDRLIELATRNVMLTVISLITTGIYPILGTLWLIFDENSAVAEFCFHLTMQLDHFTNCLCLVLTFSFYDKLYDNLCSCFHNKCNQYWSEYAGKGRQERNLAKLHLQVPKGSERANPVNDMSPSPST